MRFAIGARPRFVIGSVDGSVASEHRIAAATARSTVTTVAAAEIDDTGMLVVQGLAEGHTAIEIIDGDGVIDRIPFEVAPAGRLLCARGAITATPRVAGQLTVHLLPQLSTDRTARGSTMP